MSMITADSEPDNTDSRSHYRISEELRRRIQRRLNHFKRIAISDASLTNAAVAFAIVNVPDSDSAAFVLTRRPRHLKRHGGQFALPGGRLDRDETPIEAALRELGEETGINLSNEDVLGLLDDYATRSGFKISPVVVWAGTLGTLSPDPNEVETLYRVPLTDLDQPDFAILEESGVGDSPVLSVPIPTVGDRIFAPTAAFIYQFREVALFGRSTRVADYDQPRFAWN